MRLRFAKCEFRSESQGRKKKGNIDPRLGPAEPTHADFFETVCMVHRTSKTGFMAVDKTGFIDTVPLSKTDVSACACNVHRRRKAYRAAYCLESITLGRGSTENRQLATDLSRA